MSSSLLTQEAIFDHGSVVMIDYTPGSDVAAGEIVAIGGKCHVAHRAIASGVLGAVSAPAGTAIYKVKNDGGAFSVGDLVDWDGDKAVAAAGGNSLGQVVEEVTSGDTYVKVRLDSFYTAAGSGS